MKRRSSALAAAALSLLVLGAPLMTACGAQRNISEAVSHPPADLSSEDTLALNDEIAELTKLLETNPQDVVAYTNRGIAKGELQDTQGAIADFNKAIEINPQLAPAYANRGIANELVGDLKGACADWRKASSLGDKDAAGWVRGQCQ